MSVEEMGHTRVNIYDSSSVWLQLFEEFIWDDTNPFLIVLLGVIIVRFFFLLINICSGVLGIYYTESFLNIGYYKQKIDYLNIA